MQIFPSRSDYNLSAFESSVCVCETKEKVLCASCLLSYFVSYFCNAMLTMMLWERASVSIKAFPGTFLRNSRAESEGHSAVINMI
jgi:hypothetical protein